MAEHPSNGFKLNTRISENLQWVERYLRRAKVHMPSLSLPKQIRSYRPHLSKEQRVWGTCAIDTKIITLMTHRAVVSQNGGRRPKKKHLAIPQREMLMTLAHELSHLRFEAHNYEQESYARTIFTAFGVKDKCAHCSGSGRVLARYVN